MELRNGLATMRAARSLVSNAIFWGASITSPGTKDPAGRKHQPTTTRPFWSIS